MARPCCQDLLLAAGLLGGRLSVCAAPLLVMALASSAFGWAIDCRVEQTSENFLGVRYKAKLVHNELSSTGWTILFGTSGLSYDGEYRGHFIDLMVKVGRSSTLTACAQRGSLPPFRLTISALRSA
jgi:hypothetical protein